MSREDDTTPTTGTRLWGQPPVEWDPNRPTWADANHWHPVTDWDAYSRANVPRLVGFKVSEANLVPRLAPKWLEEAERRGLIVVGYCFGTHGVERFLEVFPPKPGRIPCLDFEGTTATVASAEAWIRRVASAYGRRPWFYGRSKWMQVGAPEGTEVAGCPAWVSQYGPRLNVPRGLGEVVAWQVSDGIHGPKDVRTHPGIEGPCDMNVLLCSIERLHQMAGLDVSPGSP